MVLHRVSAQLESVHPKMDVCSRDSGPFVAIEKRMVLNETFEQGGRLGNWVVVVTRLGPEYRRLQGTQIPDAMRPAELVDEDVVESDYLDDVQVLGQLLGQLFVELAMPRDRSLQVTNHLWSRRFTFLPGHPFGQRFVENRLKLTALLSG